jgi:hypothetical protein
MTTTTVAFISVAGSQIFSAFASSLPVPQPKCSEWYMFLYKFTNSLSANVTALRGKAQFDPPTQTEQQVTETHTATVTTAEAPKP